MGGAVLAVALDQQPERLVREPNVAADLVCRAADQARLLIQARDRILAGDRLELLGAHADAAPELHVLGPLVGRARHGRHAQDGDLAQPGVEARVAEDRAAELEERPEAARRPAEHPEEVEGRERGDRLAELRGQLLLGRQRDAAQAATSMPIRSSSLAWRGILDGQDRLHRGDRHGQLREVGLARGQPLELDAGPHERAGPGLGPVAAEPLDHLERQARHQRDPHDARDEQPVPVELARAARRRRWPRSSRSAGSSCRSAGGSASSARSSPA